MRLTQTLDAIRSQSNFNPRTHKECDVLSTTLTPTPQPFQSTHSQGVRQLLLDQVINAKPFQSTHSQGVRLNLPSCHNVGCLISIHALTRSATALLEQILGQDYYFNPRTHKECDEAVNIYNPEQDDFNPRTHKECDVTLISLIAFASGYFNPRTHKECDRNI